jgi:hypothetical protein
MEKETLEEAAERYYEDEVSINGFINGAKSDASKEYWFEKFQQEQDKNKFSEEEVLELLNDLRLHTYNYGMGGIELLEWFEQFKNK